MNLFEEKFLIPYLPLIPCMMRCIAHTVLIMNVKLNLDFSEIEKPRDLSSLGFSYLNLGNDLLSHSLTAAVSSALEGLTSVFEMGTGGTPPVRSPRKCLRIVGFNLKIFKYTTFLNQTPIFTKTMSIKNKCC